MRALELSQRRLGLVEQAARFVLRREAREPDASFRRGDRIDERIVENVHTLRERVVGGAVGGLGPRVAPGRLHVSERHRGEPRRLE